MVIKWCSMVHYGTNLLKEKYWQICGKFVALTLFFSQRLKAEINNL